ncbi:MAG: hypothetical protein NVV73_04570 [Cellvibrionaceae bacterium]|nr:hypothetical protein [Cellvibrionaceae bacterium]
MSSRPVVVRSPLGPLALLLALAAEDLIGFVYFQLQETQGALQQTRNALTSAEVRVKDLKSRLMLSDDESTQSMSVLQANIKENTAEIRKFWGVANDRNRKAIAQLETKVAVLEKPRPEWMTRSSGFGGCHRRVEGRKRARGCTAGRDQHRG